MIRVPNYLAGLGITLSLIGSASAQSEDAIPSPSDVLPPNAATNSLAPGDPALTPQTIDPGAAGRVYQGSGYQGSHTGSVTYPSVVDNGDYMGTCNTCNLGGGGIGFGTRQPKVQFMFDALIMGRENGDDSPYLFDAVTGEVLLRTGQLSPDAEPGVRTGVIFYDNSGGYDLEFSYLGIDEFRTTVTRESENGIIFPFFGGTPANPRESYTVNYASELNSGEINLRRRLGCQFTLLGGFRFLELNERFNITGDGVFASDTDNDLYGFQLGGEIHLATIRRSILFTTIKAGAYYNNIDVSATAELPGSGTIQFIDDEDDVAFVGDIAFGLLVPMGPQADLRVGYQGLFLDGVALASDQFNSFDLFTSVGSANTSTLVYHGAFIGFDLFW